jgi:hypothetical protein
MYDKLPKLRYITPQGFKDVSDITTTFRVYPKVVEEGAFPNEVAVPETDRPDVFSHRIYGNSRMHWLLLNMNNKINPYYDWVLSPAAFDNYMQEKYPGYTLFLLDVSTATPFRGSFRTNDMIYATGVTSAASQPSYSNELKNARVVSYDPTYCRMVIEFTQKTAWVPTEGEYIAGRNTNALGESTYYVARIGKAIESQFAAHHFENTDGELLNPRVPASVHNTFISPNDLGFTFGQTPLGRYVLIDEGSYTITNREHEIMENDERRTIQVVSRRYLDSVERDVETLLNNG